MWLQRTIIVLDHSLFNKWKNEVPKTFSPIFPKSSKGTMGYRQMDARVLPLYVIRFNGRNRHHAAIGFPHWLLRIEVGCN